MDRGAWWATVHGVTRVRHDLATKPSPYARHSIHISGIDLAPNFIFNIYVCMCAHIQTHTVIVKLIWNAVV